MAHCVSASVDRDRQRRILEPWHRDALLQPGVADIGKEAIERLVRSRARTASAPPATRNSSGVVMVKTGGAIAHRPEKRALHHVNVVQALTKRRVLGRRWMRLDGPPMFGIGPRLVSAEIAK